MSLNAILDRLAGQPAIPRRKKRRRAARFIVETLEQRSLLAIIIVNSTADTDQRDGNLTLREAILLADGDLSYSSLTDSEKALVSGVPAPNQLDSIVFSIGSGLQTITLASPLPEITDSTSIDGMTQPGYVGQPLIDIDGTNAGDFNGLEFDVGGNTVEGLIINNFQGEGIILEGTNDPDHNQGPGINNVVQGNFIGTDAAGENAAPNGAGGIDIINSSYNLIGGLNSNGQLTQGNLISGNRQNGVFLATGTDSHNYIEGNYIGTDVTGFKPIANAQSEVTGVALVPPLDQPDSGFASNNFIGDFDPIENAFDPNGRNIISGNTADGVLIVGGTGNRVAGNYIGLAWDGITPLPNGFDGVHLEDASSNIVGGTEEGARNIISGNSQNGVTIISDAATFYGLAIPASEQSSRNNVVAGNFIGTDFSGASPVPNGDPSATGKNQYGEGVALENLSDNPTVFVTNNTIGGADGDDGAVDGDVKAQNLISGNWDNGIFMAGEGVMANKAEGNYIGTDITGKHPLNNSNFGILLNAITGQVVGPAQNLIGSTSIGGGNLISGNGTPADGNAGAVGGGVAIENGASENFVANNLIGTDASGLKFLPNAGDGVLIAAAADLNVIGGTSDDSENVISGNDGNGVTITNANTNFLEKNFIGVGLDGATLLQNANGVVLVGASGNFIGDVAAVGSQENNLGNVIAANAGAGILLSAQSNSNQVLGNMIGTDFSGTVNAGNGDVGILINNSSGNRIGGIDPATGLPTTVARNLIVFNGSDGIDLEQASGNVIEGDYVGIGADGARPEGNKFNGILINNSPSNTIGGGAILNVISDNGLDGVQIGGQQSQSNVVAASFIGTTADGANAAPNGGSAQEPGIDLFGSGIVIKLGASSNTIGGDGPEGNLISGNTLDGIVLSGAGQNNTIKNNQIGTNVAGNGPPIGATTQLTGIGVDNTPGTKIGVGSFEQGGNVISGNQFDGIFVDGPGSTGTVITGNYIGTDSTATAALGNGRFGVNLASGSYTGTSGPSSGTIIDGNTIAGNLQGGIELVGGTNANHIKNNFIGTNESETTSSALSNRGFGIKIDGSPGNFIGEANAGNEIVNTAGLSNQDTTVGDGDGLWITGTASMNNDVADEVIIGNTGDGIEIAGGASTNKIGNTQSNVICANLNGIVVTDSGTQHNTVQNNLIGIGENGVTKGNTEDGVAVMDGASNNTIGAATTAGASNVISANGDNGIDISGETTTDNSVLGNYIGTDLNGKSQKGQGFGNTLAGVEVSAPDTFIGGSSTGEGNVIVGNNNGISLDFSTADGIFVEGDDINNNRFDGIVVNNGAFANHIGGPDNADANSIHDNGTDGVLVFSGSQISIQHNKIFNNAKLGIELAPGANADAPAPFLSLATPTRIAGWLQATPNTTYTIEFFSGTSSQHDDMSEDDDAETLVQPLLLTHTSSGELAEQPFQQVTTNGSGVALFDLALGQSPALNAVIRATATDGNGNTSAFSNAVTVGVDSNADGVPDSQQNGNLSANNVSFPDALNPGDPSQGIPPAFVSLSAPGVQQIFDVWSTPDPDPNPDPNEKTAPPANTQFPFGFVSFSLVGVEAPPTPVRVTLTLPDTGTTPTSYWRYVQPQGDQPGHWYQWDYDSKSDTGAVLPGQIDPHTNQVVGPGQIVLYFVDGGRGDDDGTVNGIIVDAGSPGFDPYNVITTADDGPGSLRQAILAADANPGSHITFDIPGSGPQTIQLLSALPTITANVTIDGSTQPGFDGTPLVVLDGSQAGASADGLTVASGFATIQDLVVNQFSSDGIHVLSAGAAQISDNYIGTDASGKIAEGNGLYGIEIEDDLQHSHHGTGGPKPGGPSTINGGNVISANAAGGISIHGVSANDNSVTSNVIGTEADGVSPLGNQGPGVVIDGGSSGNSIGLHFAGDSNTIAFNAGPGVSVLQGTGNLIEGNSIFANQGLGIDLGGDGVTPNDPDDADNGPNDLQNFPVLASAASYGGRTFISGSLSSAPDLFYTIEFYSTDATNSPGLSQGQVFLGSISVGTDDSGQASFDANLAMAATAGSFITATAVFGSDTSEFSAPLQLTPINPLVLIVNTTDDVNDAVPDPTHFSLREAILAANNHAGQDIIDFDLPNLNRVILPQSALPDITDPVIIDGTSQPGFQSLPLVEINGSQAAATSALTISGGGSIVRGLVIDGFQNDVTLTSLGGNTLEGNFLGTDVTGTRAGSGDVAGVFVNNSPDNVIGGTSAADRNVTISIVLDGSDSTNNVVEGNYITTDLTGTALLLGASNPLNGNAPTGVLLADGASSNTIGGAVAGAQNVIAAGISIPAGYFNTIQGNLIGTDFTGTQFLAQLGSLGVVCDGNLNMIGGTLPGDRNIIAGGILLQGNENTVQGNYVGTDVTGMISLVSELGATGIRVPIGVNVTGDNNLVGGPAPGAGNLISGFANSNTFPATSGFPTAGVVLGGQFNFLEGNLIGTDVTGTKPLANNTGVYVDGLDNQIGGTAAGDGNVISGNQTVGITVTGDGSGTIIEGNYVGTDRTGTRPLGNGLVMVVSTLGSAFAAMGIDASGPNVVIGGAQPGAGNVISANGGDGIAVGGINLGTASETTIEGNFIGLDATGTEPLGNAGNGIGIYSSANTVIGVAVLGAGNVISANGGDGIHVANTNGQPPVIGNLSPGTVIEGNKIGTDVTGTERFGNAADGVSIITSVFGESDETVGGTQPDAGNLIAFNGGRGVDIPFGNGNIVRGNDIFDNGSLGLITDVRGAASTYAENRDVTLSEPVPVLTSAVFDPQGTVVSGSLTGSPFTRYEIDFFANDAVNPTGFGDGQAYLQSISVPVDDTGSVQFQIPLDDAVPIGEWITATATPDTTDGNTSMFSQPTPVIAAVGNSIQFSLPKYLVTETGGAATIVVTRSGDTSGPATVDYATGGGTAADGVNYTAESGTLTFASGVTSQAITIPVEDDGLADGDHDVQVLLSNPSGASLGVVSDADVTIADSDTAGEIQFASANDYFDVGSGRGNAVFTLTRTGGTQGTVTVDFGVTGGTAINDASVFLNGVPLGNASNNAGTVTFAPGQTTAQITFVFGGISEGVSFDGVTPYQGPITVEMTLGNPTGGATLGGLTTSTLTIDYAENANGAFGINIGTAVVGTFSTSQVGANGGQAQIEIGRVGNLSTTESVSYTTVDGTATAGTNYVATSGTITFQPGQGFQDIDVPVLGGPLGSTEAFQVVLSNPTGGAFIEPGFGQWTVTILGTTLPLPEHFEVEPNQSFDGDGGSALVTVERLDDNSRFDEFVLYSTSDGTAKAGTDYQAVSGALVFDPGQQFATFSVPLLANTMTADDLTFDVMLGSGPTNATIDTNPVPVTLTYTAVPVQFASPNYSVAENSADLTVTVIGRPFATVDYATHDGTATAGADYTPVSGTLTFGQNGIATITIPILNDLLPESNETFGVTLSGPKGGLSLGETDTATITILDEDAPQAVPSTTTLTSDMPNGSTYGQTVSLTAVVGAASGMPTGSVDFVDTSTGQDLGSVLLEVVNGLDQATISVSSLIAESHTIVASFTSDNGNFIDSHDSLVQSVAPAPFTITAHDQTMIYGGALPDLTVSYSGFVNGDTSASLTTLPTVTAPTTNHVGNYTGAIVASGASDPNYTISYVAGTLTVTPAPLTITAGDQTMTYGGTLPTLTVTYTGLVNGDTLAMFATSPNIAPTLTTPANNHAGTYAKVIVASGASDPDYTISYAAGTLKVTPAALTITANNQTMSYGGTLPALTVAYLGLANGDTPATFNSNANVAPSVTAPSNNSVGTYVGVILASGASDVDYTISYVPGTLTVTPATLTVAADNKSMVAGATLPVLTDTITGFVNGDTLSVVSGTAALSTTATSISPAGSYPIAVAQGTLSAANYTFDFSDGTLEITPAGGGSGQTAISATAVPVVGYELSPPSTVTVATFTDGSGSLNASDFSAAIDWGDGTSSAGNITLASSAYTVTGSHEYHDEGHYDLMVSIDQTAGPVTGGTSASVTATATIHEQLLANATVGTPDENWVQEVYRDLFNRQAELQGLDYWVALLSQGETRQQVAYQMVQIASFEEFQHNTVAALYEQYLGRAPDAGGLASWSAYLYNGGTIEGLSQALVTSPEYWQTRAGGTANGFISALFHDALGRAVEQVAMTYFIGLMSQGAAAADVAAAIFSSDEYHRLRINALFEQFMDRPADSGALTYFATALDNEGTDALVITQLLASEEYFDHAQI